MAAAKKAAAKAAPSKKPAARVIAVKRAEPAEDTGADAPVELVKGLAEPVEVYKATGRIQRNGITLRPADPATGREADTVELTEREAFGLRGFVEPAEPAAETPTE
ncbi:hypothetical protein D9M69_687320 [compost metagenome]